MGWFVVDRSWFIDGGGGVGGITGGSGGTGSGVGKSTGCATAGVGGKIGAVGCVNGSKLVDWFAGVCQNCWLLCPAG